MTMAAANLVYSVLIEPWAPEDGDGFVAVVPDLPGCMSDGATAGEALANVKDAISAWLDEARAWASRSGPFTASCRGRIARLAIKPSLPQSAPRPAAETARSRFPIAASTAG